MNKMSRRVGTSRQCRGFSLIELLVVIAIIAVLLALLMPFIRGALDKGRDATCIGRMKGMGQAIEMYVRDNDNYYPSGKDTDGIWATQHAKVSASNQTLVFHLAPYLDIDTAAQAGEYAPAVTCPGVSRLKPKRKDNAQYVLNHSITLGSESNYSVWGYAGDDKKPKRRLDVQVDQWLMSDTDKTHFRINPGWGNYANFADTPGHWNKWNFLFMDMRVGSL